MGDDVRPTGEQRTRAVGGRHGRPTPAPTDRDRAADGRLDPGGGDAAAGRMVGRRPGALHAAAPGAGPGRSRGARRVRIGWTTRALSRGRAGTLLRGGADPRDADPAGI